jgi:hypothetical protein
MDGQTLASFVRESVSACVFSQDLVFLAPAVQQNQPGWHQTQDDWAVS